MYESPTPPISINTNSTRMIATRPQSVPTSPTRQKKNRFTQINLIRASLLYTDIQIYARKHIHMNAHSSPLYFIHPSAYMEKIVGLRSNTKYHWKRYSEQHPSQDIEYCRNKKSHFADISVNICWFFFNVALRYFISIKFYIPTPRSGNFQWKV